MASADDDHKCRIDLSNGQGKLLKTIIKDSVSESEMTPQPGCQVTVHYTGKLKMNSQVFDSSRERGRPFTFELDAGNVIRGWDIGVATMRKGEVAIFDIHSEYGYGDKGAGDQIPPDADLVFEIELIGWTYPDVSLKQDKSFIKQIRKVGEGWERPNEECMTVTVKIELYVSNSGTVLEPSDSLPNTVVDDRDSIKIAQENNFEFIYGDEMIHPFLERAIGGMKKGEQASFFLRKQSSELDLFSEDEWNFFIYSPELKKALLDMKLGLFENMRIDIELVNFVREPQVWNLTYTDKIAYCNKKKNEGNQFFVQNRSNMALKRYNQVVNGVEASDHNLTEDQKRELEKFKAIAFNNAAAILLGQEQYLEAQNMCDKVLDIDSENIKALFRRAQSFTARGDSEKAVQDLKKAQQLDPNNGEIARQLNLLLERIRQEKTTEKNLYKKMFQST